MNETLSQIGPYLAIALAGAVLIRQLLRASARSREQEGPAPTPSETPAAVAASGIPAHHLVVISAAAYAMAGAHRIVHIGTAPTGQSWSVEGRIAHHASHQISHH
ncbi:MAG: hypothetical protein NVV74_24255 [Magnetospirillum sp.]|nr:hypothetical protein [Magnetospirillum sp.]